MVFNVIEIFGMFLLVLKVCILKVVIGSLKLFMGKEGIIISCVVKICSFKLIVMKEGLL